MNDAQFKVDIYGIFGGAIKNSDVLAAVAGVLVPLIPLVLFFLAYFGVALFYRFCRRLFAPPTASEHRRKYGARRR